MKTPFTIPAIKRPAIAKRTIGDDIRLLPAWPKEWDVDFKLHAPQNTTVEVVLRKGTEVTLKVSPESRQKDIVINPEF
jgi:hypothetical protein